MTFEEVDCPWAKAYNEYLHSIGYRAENIKPADLAIFMRDAALEEAARICETNEGCDTYCHRSDAYAIRQRKSGGENDTR